MNELQKYALTIATPEELKEAFYIILKGKTYNFNELFPNGIIGLAPKQETEYQPIKN